MVFFNHATRQMTAKIVYYGPGLCGKTTNLNTIYGKTSQKARGEMVSLNTETDRTLFFDLLPMDVGVIGGFRTKLQLYTVPGQVFYNSTRKLVLKGVDGIVFVADSQVPMLDANKESLQNLEANLRELGLDIRAVPMVFQWNKRDLKNIVPIQDLEQELNAGGRPSFQSNAQEGTGVFETLRGITKLALTHIKAHHLGETNPAKAEVAPAATAVDAPPRLDADSTGARPLSMADLLPTSEVLPEVPVPVPVLKMPMPIVAPARPMAPAVSVKPAAPSLKPMLSPVIAAPKPKGVVPAMTPVSSLLGDLTSVNLGGALRIELPAEVDGAELEVHVEVRQGGRILGQGQVRRAAPASGGIAKLTLELKRS